MYSVTVEVVLLNGKDGSVSIRYTLSEYPLIEGRTYEVIQFDNQPNAQVAGEPYFTYSDYVICFAAGMMIETVAGPRKVESLREGDLVHTSDSGLQPIRWTNCSTQPLDHTEHENKPILIKAGALGQGYPAEDVIVSPQHRILVGGQGQLQDIFEDEALVPAKALTKLPGVRFMNGKRQVTWVHFACDRHEIVRANGCLAESLLVAPMTLRSISFLQRRKLVELFPKGNMVKFGALNGLPARSLLPVRKAQRKVDQYVQMLKVNA